MKKIIFLIVTVLFVLTINAQTTVTTGSDDKSKTRTTTTVVGKNTIVTTTTEDNSGNTVILTQNIRKRLKNWNFVVISKSGEVKFTDSGKRRDFERTSGYASGDYTTKRGLGFQFFTSPDAGRVQGGRIDMSGRNRSF